MTRWARAPRAAGLLALLALAAWRAAPAGSESGARVFLPLLGDRPPDAPEPSASATLRAEPFPSPSSTVEPSPSLPATSAPAPPSPSPSPSPSPQPSPSPTRPAARWVADIGGSGMAVAALGQTAYLGEGHRVVVVDMSGHGHARRAGQRGPFADTVRDLAVADGLLYVAAGSAGLRVFDLAVPLAPREVGALDTPGDLRAMVIAGSRAILADGPGGLRIVDVADPAAPRELGFLDTVMPATGLDVAGDVAYVSVADERSAGLLTVDLSEAARPRELGAVSSPGEALGVAAAGGYAYLADGAAGLQVVEVADPRHLRLLPGAGLRDVARSVLIRGDEAYVAGATVEGGSELWVADLFRPGFPRLARSLAMPGRAEDMVVAGDRLLVADELNGLSVFQRRPGAAELRVAVLDRPGFHALGLAVGGGLAYVTTPTGLRVIDVADPRGPQLLGGLDTLSDVPGPLVVWDGHAYVSLGFSGLQVVDVSRPGSPRSMGRMELGPVEDLSLSGSRLAMVDRGSQMVGLLDLARLDRPGAMSRTVASVRAAQVALAGERVYVGGGVPGTLVALGLGEPFPFHPLGELGELGSFVDLTVDGRLAYVLDGEAHLRVIDVLYPERMRELGRLTLRNAPARVQVGGGRAYMAKLKDGLAIADVSRPETPALLAILDTPGQAVDVALDGDYAYVADGTGGLQVFEVQAPPARR